MTRPVLAVLVLAVVAGLFFTLQRVDDAVLTPAGPDLRLPRYTLNDALLTRYDADGTPALKATAATLEYYDDESAKGTTLNVDVLSGTRTPWNLTAPAAMLPAHQHAFRLEGGPVIAKGQWPDNREDVTITTTLVWVDPDQHEFHTDRALTFQSATRDGSATGLRSNWTNRNMTLLNDVKMHYEARH